ncbi:hypothetical protein DM01DRAFT_1334784 [Hesseltinella vesiculosa]|uniref:Uncharacterized protein n=1 Tax=Hesseltinella vesiculosa TaxID=101127 RepID=A0A1X2GL21_9FUNG|nr:hypothetical protein DM01DRAFT_1334784 [Hesseltinella vesiculosa]
MDNNWKTALEDYINSTKYPRFSGFILKYKNDIPSWSSYQDVNSSHGLHGIWVERYISTYKKMNETNKRPKSSQRFNKEIWDKIYLNFAQKKLNESTTLDMRASTSTSSLTSCAEHDSSLSSDSASQSTSPGITHSASMSSNPQGHLSIIPQAPGQDRFIVDETDVSERFYQLQQCVHGLVERESVTVEADVDLILSLCSILLLQNNNRIHQAMLPYFGNHLYTKVRVNSIDLGLSTNNFDPNTKLDLMNIAEAVYHRKLDIYQAGSQILDLAKANNNLIEKRMILSTFHLLQALPFDNTNQEFSETTLITRYLAPALQPLFDERERNIRFEFTGTDLDDKQKRPPAFSGLPDLVITVFPHGSDDGINVGYGEVKKASMATNSYLVNWDLVRLAIFSKDAIDSNHITGNFAIHVVAPDCTFYLMKLTADGLYTMSEVDRIRLPMSVQDLPAYVSTFNRLKAVLEIFAAACNPEIGKACNPSWQRPSLLATDLTAMLDIKRNRRRKNSTGHKAR